MENKIKIVNTLIKVEFYSQSIYLHLEESDVYLTIPEGRAYIIVNLESLSTVEEYFAKKNSIFYKIELDETYFIRITKLDDTIIVYFAIENERFVLEGNFKEFGEDWTPVAVFTKSDISDELNHVYPIL